ncbi:MAG: CapA family protein, partial [Pseudomonadota bacterium]
MALNAIPGGTERALAGDTATAAHLTRSIETGSLPRTAAATASPNVGTEARRERPAPGSVLTLVVVGDTGFGGSMQPINPRGGRRHGRTIPYAKMTSDVAPLIDGDINFANLETVVTSTRGLSAVPKAFKFRSHTNGVAHLIDNVGFNLFALANNHAVDFGRTGLRETLAAMESLEHRVLGYAGLGFTWDQTAKPWTFQTHGVQVAFSAIGIGASASTWHPPRRAPQMFDAGHVGQLPYSDAAMSDVERHMRAARVDLRLVSVHTGIERQLTPLARDRDRFAALARAPDGHAGADVIIGHHAHVVQGIQQLGGTTVLYGLGNFLHPGMQDMGKFGRCRDFGLVAKLHLMVGSGARPQLAAIEAFPIVNMHATPKPLTKGSARVRIGVLNGLARGLDDPRRAGRGVRFGARRDGTGLHCTALGRRLPGKVGALCRAWLKRL